MANKAETRAYIMNSVQHIKTQFEKHVKVIPTLTKWNCWAKTSTSFKCYTGFSFSIWYASFLVFCSLNAAYLFNCIPTPYLQHFRLLKNSCKPCNITSLLVFECISYISTPHKAHRKKIDPWPILAFSLVA